MRIIPLHCRALRIQQVQQIQYYGIDRTSSGLYLDKGGLASQEQHWQDHSGVGGNKREPGGKKASCSCGVIIICDDCEDPPAFYESHWA